MKHYEFSDKFPLLTSILDNTWFQVLVNFLTIYALFGDDIRIIAFDKRADDGFDVITIICMVNKFNILDNIFNRNYHCKHCKK